ncbi:MAG: hypothetical protein IIB89_02705, partial [Chloroflexi bacterium]|nr:hypothetical protein [Chloroflexota bacterium]
MKVAESKKLRGKIQGLAQSANPRWGYNRKTGEENKGIGAATARKFGGFAGYAKRAAVKPVEGTLVKTQQNAQEKLRQEAMKAKAIAQGWQTTFFKGDSDTDPREFDGLQKRVIGDQLLANGSTGGGDPLSLDKLDEVIDLVMDPMALLISKTMRRKLTAA